MADFDIRNIKNITDDNIHLIVEFYFYSSKPNLLPKNLRSISKWDVSRVTTMIKLFEPFPTFNESLNEWDVSNVTDMSGMFNGCAKFNQPLNKWNVSNVTVMTSMFSDCDSFNQPLNNWNVSKVTDMKKMFNGCVKFNQPLNTWNVSKVTDMTSMFNVCVKFNQPLNKWNVSNVTGMTSMFSECESFNQPLNNWNVSKVTDMKKMFWGCESFNQPLDKWDVSKVTNMDEMFSGCESFNQPLASWNVSNVTKMSGMFIQAMRFNQPLARWNVSNVTEMSWMFIQAYSFDQPLNDWDVRNVINRQGMFDQSAMSDENKPNFGEQPPRVSVDPYQIHKAAGKINYNKLNEILKEKSGSPDRPLDLDFPIFINTSIAAMIDASEESVTEKETKRNGLNQIITQRIDGVNYTNMSPLLLDSIYYTLNYVKKQSIPFQDNYVNTFIQECVQAYEGEGSVAMTCAAGALERIVNSLVTPCELLISSEPEEDDDTKTQCELLKSIISYNPKKLVIEYINDWYKLHTKEPFPEGTSEDEKRDDLKTYLLEKLPGQEELIESNIAGLDFDDDAFNYSGGRNRKTIRKRKNGKRQTKKKRQTKRKSSKPKLHRLKRKMRQTKKKM